MSRVVPQRLAQIAHRARQAVVADDHVPPDRVDQLLARNHPPRVLDQQPGLVEKKMFGGVAFLIQGNMAVGVHKDMLMVRVGPDAYDETMKYHNTRPFDLTGRAMKGWVLVEPDGITSESELKEWVEAGVNFALTLPPK